MKLEATIELVEAYAVTEKHIKNLQYKKRLEKYKKHTKFKEDEVSKIENQIIIENQKLKELDSPEQLEIENKRREALGAVNAIKIVFEQQISNTLGRNNLTRPKNSNNIKNVYVIIFGE